MTFYVCIQLGDWKFENGHFYRLELSQNHNGKVTWITWRKIL